MKNPWLNPLKEYSDQNSELKRPLSVKRVSQIEIGSQKDINIRKDDKQKKVHIGKKQIEKANEKERYKDQENEKRQYLYDENIKEKGKRNILKEKVKSKEHFGEKEKCIEKGYEKKRQSRNLQIQQNNTTVCYKQVNWTKATNIKEKLKSQKRKNSNIIINNMVK